MPKFKSKHPLFLPHRESPLSSARRWVDLLAGPPSVAQAPAAQAPAAQAPAAQAPAAQAPAPGVRAVESRYGEANPALRTGRRGAFAPAPSGYMSYTDDSGKEVVLADSAGVARRKQIEAEKRRKAAGTAKLDKINTAMASLADLYADTISKGANEGTSPEELTRAIAKAVGLDRTEAGYLLPKVKTRYAEATGRFRPPAEGFASPAAGGTPTPGHPLDVGGLGLGAPGQAPDQRQQANDAFIRKAVATGAGQDAHPQDEETLRGALGGTGRPAAKPMPAGNLAASMLQAPETFADNARRDVQGIAASDLERLSQALPGSPIVDFLRRVQADPSAGNIEAVGMWLNSVFDYLRQFSGTLDPRDPFEQQLQEALNRPGVSALISLWNTITDTIPNAPTRFWEQPITTTIELLGLVLLAKGGSSMAGKAMGRRQVTAAQTWRAIPQTPEATWWGGIKPYKGPGGQGVGPEVGPLPAGLSTSSYQAPRNLQYQGPEVMVGPPYPRLLERTQPGGGAFANQVQPGEAPFTPGMAPRPEPVPQYIRDKRLPAVYTPPPALERLAKSAPLGEAQKGKPSQKVKAEIERVKAPNMLEDLRVDTLKFIKEEVGLPGKTKQALMKKVQGAKDLDELIDVMDQVDALGRAFHGSYSPGVRSRQTRGQFIKTFKGEK